MRKIFLLCLFLGFFTATAAKAATYYVSTTGSDTNPGTLSAPFKTIQKGANVALAGDLVIVKAGVYRERVSAVNSGSAGAPITFQGEVGTIIDGGDRFSGWDPAPEIGNGVFKKSLPYAPGNMTWNDKYILEINSTYMQDGRGASYLAMAPTDTGWDGIEAYFGTLNGVTYVRFRNWQDPDNENISLAPKPSGTFRISGKNFITVRGFTMRNSYNQIKVDSNSSDAIIENNYLFGGHETVALTGGATRTHVRNNEITLDYVYSNFGHNWLYSLVDNNVWGAFKSQSTGDRVGINISNAGADNQVYGNHVFRHFDGIDQQTDPWSWNGTAPQNRDKMAQFNRGLKIYNNTLENLQDSGMEAMDAGINAEWHDNLVFEATADLRIKHIAQGPMYIYRNRAYNSTRVDYSKGTPVGHALNMSINGDPDTPGILYFYHNTLEIDGTALNFATTPNKPTTFGLANFWFINNIFSSGRFWASQGFTDTPASHMNYNWAGGSFNTSNWPALQNNIFAPGQSLWPDRTAGDFQLTATSPARAKGIDLSKNWVVDGTNNPALPGMTTGYFSGTAPDLGAIQFGVAPTPTPTPTTTPSPTPTTKTYTLTCTGPGGTTSKSVSVNVTSPPPPFCSYFTASPSKIIWPSKSTLSWSCQNTQSCDISPGVGSVNKIGGTVQVSPSSTTTYFLSCFGAGSSIYETATVVEVVPPAIKEVRP